MKGEAGGQDCTATPCLLPSILHLLPRDQWCAGQGRARHARPPTHLASSWVLTARRQYMGSPCLATRRIANSCWYMMTAARKEGLQEGGGAQGTHAEWRGGSR